MVIGPSRPTYIAKIIIHFPAAENHIDAAVVGRNDGNVFSGGGKGAACLKKAEAILKEKARMAAIYAEYEAIKNADDIGMR